MGIARSFRPKGSLAASGSLAPYAGAWGSRQAAHLLRRAGFGGSRAHIARIAAASPAEAAEALTSFQSVALPSEPVYGADPYDLAYPLAAGAERIDRIKNRRMLLYYKADMVVQMWWLQHMLDTPWPLREKMTLFWHGHFTSAMGNKGVRPKDAVTQNQVFRKYALGNIRDLTQTVSRDAAMLKYLDNVYSRKEHPNENYARELMELFTLGIGAYTEKDVRESARAFTGRTIDWRSGAFYENMERHDAGEKCFLGRTGHFNGNDIVNIIFEQPAAPRLFARKLLSFFVYNDPEPELVNEVAALLAEHDFELAPVMKTLLGSNVFYSERAYRALVKSPVEFVIGSYHLCGVRVVTPETLDALGRMGQELFSPPSVKGWDGGTAWLNSQTFLARENFLYALMLSSGGMGRFELAADAPLHAQAAARALAENVLQSDLTPCAVAELAAYLNGAASSGAEPLSAENAERRLRGGVYLIAATPAYQLA